MPLPDKVSRYELVGPLEAGASGSLFKAWDPYFERHVALKAIATDRSRDVEFQRRFQAKAQAVSQLKHPNIVETYDWIEEGGTAYQVLELLDGTTLRGRMEAEKKANRGEPDGLPLSLKDKIRILIGVLRGIHEAHERGVIHGDLDPGKIFIPRSGEAKVLDFGVGPEMATIAPMSQLQSMNLLAYLSPEHLSRRELDGRADVWACGVILYELVAGQVPFRISPQGVRQSELEPLSQIDPEFPAELQEIVEKALAEDPKDRYRSASEMADELAWLLESMSQRNTVFELELAGVAESFLERIQEHRETLRGKLGQGVMDPDEPLDRSLKSILQSDLGDARAMMLRFSGDLERLERRVDELLARIDRARGLLMDAAAHEQAGDVKGALRKADRIAEEFPGLSAGPELAEALHAKLAAESNAERLVAAAREFQTRGNLERARGLVEEAMKLEPQRSDALMLHQRLSSDIRTRAEEIRGFFQAATDSEQEGDLKTAFDLAKKVLERDRSHGPAKQLVARVESKVVAAEKIARARKVFDKAQLFIDVGERQDALAFLEEALTLDPDLHAAREIRDRLAEEVELERRRESRRGFEERNHNLLRDAEKSRDRGAFAEALEQAESVSAESEAHPAALELIAGVEVRMRSMRALEDAEKRFEQNEVELALEMVGALLESDPSFEEAAALRKRLEEEVARRSRSERFSEALHEARRAERSGEPERALELGRYVLEEDPNNQEALFLVERVMDHQHKVASLLKQARSFLRAGRPDIALRRLNTLYPLAPDLVEAARLRAQAQEKLSLRTTRGKVVFARKQMRRYPNAAAGLLAAVSLAVLVTTLLLIFDPFGGTARGPENTPKVLADGMGYAWIDASPWTRVSWLERDNRQVQQLSQQVTPLWLPLPSGSYRLEFENHLDEAAGRVEATFDVVSGETVEVTLAVADPDALSRGVLDGWEPTPARACGERLSAVLSAGDAASPVAQLRELVRVVPTLPEGEEGDLCRELIDRQILAGRAGRAVEAGALASSALVDGEVKGELSEANTLVVKSARVALGLLRKGDLAAADSSIGSARVLAPEDPLVVFVVEDLAAAWKATNLFAENDYQAALRAAAALVDRDPLNETAEKLALRAKNAFIELGAGRVLEDRDGSLGPALTMATRRHIERGEIRDAWNELRSLPLSAEHSDVKEVAGQLERKALGEAHRAILDILSGRRAAGVERLEDAIAALPHRPSMHLYLALGYQGLSFDERGAASPDDELLVRARDAIWQALKLERDIEPPPEWFSPRFTALVREVRQERKAELDAYEEASSGSVDGNPNGNQNGGGLGTMPDSRDMS